MKTIVNKIQSLRDDGNCNIVQINENRYCIDLLEENNTKTAYFFSSPVYKKYTGELVNNEFQKKNDRYIFNGSNSTAVVDDTGILLRCENSDVHIDLHTKGFHSAEDKLVSDNVEIVPTFNGIQVRQFNFGSNKSDFYITFKNRLLYVRDNKKYVSFMVDDYLPLITVSVIGIFDKNGNIYESGYVFVNELDENRYKVEFTSLLQDAESVLVFDINVHEKKLFNDTTVESKNPFENNVYGSMAYIGNSESFGEQWLYTKIAYSILVDSTIQNLNKVYLYIPKHGNGETQLSATGIIERFCSFGSNWDNKISENSQLIDSSVIGEYYRFDLSDFIINPQTKDFEYFLGLIIRTKNKGEKFSAVSTGDNCSALQFLEINYQ